MVAASTIYIYIYIYIYDSYNLPDVLTTFKRPWEETPPSIPLTADADSVYRPEVLDFIEIQSPEF